MADELKVVESNTGIFGSKLQISSVCLIAISIIADPETQKYIGQFIPPEIFTKITGGIGLLMYLLRKYFTGRAVRIEDVEELCNVKR